MILPQFHGDGNGHVLFLVHGVDGELKMLVVSCESATTVAASLSASFDITVSDLILYANVLRLSLTACTVSSRTYFWEFKSHHQKGIFIHAITLVSHCDPTVWLQSKVQVAHFIKSMFHLIQAQTQVSHFLFIISQYNS